MKKGTGGAQKNKEYNASGPGGRKPKIWGGWVLFHLGGCMGWKGEKKKGDCCGYGGTESLWAEEKKVTEQGKRREKGASAHLQSDHLNFSITLGGGFSEGFSGKGKKRSANIFFVFGHK